jgi:hypothetical protein
VEPCEEPSRQQCRAGDEQLAEWALGAWQKAGEGRLQFKRVGSRSEARLFFLWAGGRDGLYGEARPVRIQGQPGAVIFILGDTSQLSAEMQAEARRDPLLRETIVYLTCLHESGHALGMRHSADFLDVMYTFSLGGDTNEYFGRYRRKLRQRADLERAEAWSAQDQQRLREALAMMKKTYSALPAGK